MVLFPDSSSALCIPLEYDVDLNEVHSVSFLADNDGMDEKGGF
jgi:hypothetical protein